MEKMYVFGHRNPDTDSVTAAITLSYLKKQLGINAIPAVLSSVGQEAKFALDYFKIPEPIFLNDVKMKIKDLKYTKNYMIYATESIYNAYHYMERIGISKIPVIDQSKKMLGIVSMKDIAKDNMRMQYNQVDAMYDNILTTLSAEQVLKFDENIKGNLLVAGYSSTTFLGEVDLDSDSILIVGDRHNIIEYAINCKIKLIVVTGNHDVKEEHIKLAKEHNVNIIKTAYNTLYATKVFSLANNVSTILVQENLLCINENDDLSDFIKIANKTRYSYYPVLNKNERCLGILRFSDIGYSNKQKVILVDHNSYEQSAVGLEEAEIVEIVDHHNIGSIGTNLPISFRNMPVGSTNTIIYNLYKENNIYIPENIAGLMLSGILSDTLILTSPTTTEIDKMTVIELSKICGVNYKKYGMEMIKAGSSLKGKTKEEILYSDFKTYPVSDKKIGLGQINTTNIEEITNEIDEYLNLLNEVSNANGYHFVVLFVTDIINNGSYVFYSKNAEEILRNAFNNDKLTEGTMLKGIISRKKQILPKIIESMENN